MKKTKTFLLFSSINIGGLISIAYQLLSSISIRTRLANGTYDDFVPDIGSLVILIFTTIIIIITKIIILTIFLFKKKTVKKLILSIIYDLIMFLIFAFIIFIIA